MSSRALLSLLALTALCAACGKEAGGDAGARDTVDPATQVQVQFRATRGSEPVSATLTCGPVGGDHPRAQEACAAIEQNEDALRELSKDIVCTEIYGGPETATVSGTVRGRPVEAQFSRSNGCEIGRWDALDPLLRLRD
jgi:Subtilisin inhibitor-like